MFEAGESRSAAANDATQATVESIVVTIPVSAAMHERVVAICERRGVDIATVVEDLLERHFPPLLQTMPEVDESNMIPTKTTTKKKTWRMRLVIYRSK